MPRVRLCPTCGALTLEREHCRPRPRRQPFRHTRAWRKLSETFRAEWVAAHGWWCPGWKRPAHASRDLTVDHILAVALGGALFDRRNLRVLCRSCNWRAGQSIVAKVRVGYTLGRHR